MTSEREQLENQIDELRRQFKTLLDSLNEDNRGDIGQKLKENLAAQDRLREQRDQVLNRELATHTMTEQQRTEIVAALLRRFPKLATVKLEPKAIGKALATIEWHTSRIARAMVIDDCTPTEAIATIDRLNA
jgi:phosphoglycerate-specific signal transduction histidine kinase